MIVIRNSANEMSGHELKLDHGTICPIVTTRPAGDLPVVPFLTNILGRH